MAREAGDIRNSPQPGDVIEFQEFGDGEMELFDRMLRVVAVAEDKVWAKEYGIKGHHIVSLGQWRERLSKAANGGEIIVIRGADQASTK